MMSLVKKTTHASKQGSVSDRGVVEVTSQSDEKPSRMENGALTSHILMAGCEDPDS